MPKADTAVKDEVVADATTTAPAAEENKTEVAEDDDVLEQSLEELVGDELKDESETEDKPGDSKESDKPAEETKETPQPPAKGYEQRKEQLQGEIKDLSAETGTDPNAEIRDLVARRNALKDLQEAKARETQLASESELLNEVNPDTGDYYTPQEAERIARALSLQTSQQTAAQASYQAQVRQNQITLDSEASQALKDFPAFNPDSTDYKPELAQSAAQMLAQNLITDPQTGEIIGSNLSPYALLKTLDDAAKSAATEGQLNGQKATEQMLANVDTPGGASNATVTKKDPLLDGFDEEANRW